MMSDAEFDAFAQSANEELDEKQDALEKKYRMGKWEEWGYDAETGKLIFKDKKGVVKVEADAIEIGSFSSKSSSWQWAWANKSLPPAKRKQSECTKAMYKLTGMDVFKMPMVEIDEGMAWELTAMVVKHLKAHGCYSMTASKDLRVFVAIQKVQSVAQKA